MISLRKKSNYTAEVFTSSMNDIMFFLMLFFIIVSTLLNPGMIKLAMPRASNTQSIHRKEINLTMTGDKGFYVNNDRVSFENLESQLKKEIDRSPDSYIMLRFDRSLSIQDLVDVLALGNKLNSKMIIATEKKK